MILEIIREGGKLTGWGKNGPAYFFPRGKNGPAHSFLKKKLTGGEIPACYSWSMSHHFKIGPITFQGSGLSEPILFSCEKILL